MLVQRKSFCFGGEVGFGSVCLCTLRYTFRIMGAFSNQKFKIKLSMFESLRMKTVNEDLS